MDDDEKTRTIPTVPLPAGSGGPRGTNDSLIVIYTKEPTMLGKRFVLEHSPTCIGRGADNHIVLDGDVVSRHHAKLEHRGDAWLVLDLGSSNGTYCNDVDILCEAVLKNGDRLNIGATVFTFLSGADVEAQYHEEIYRLTIMDGLTQIYNKRYLYEALDREILRSRRHERDLSVLMFDIDHFKRVNDVYGHLAGDFVLGQLARVVQVWNRSDMVFARYGGQEFAVVLPETTLDGAVALADTLRQKVSDHHFVFESDTIHVTISIGASSLQESDRGAGELVKRANTSLHFAKNAGRNCVIAAPDVRADVDAEQMAHRNHHAVLHVDALLEKTLQENPRGYLIAFEIEGEAAVVAHLGSSHYHAWFGELVSDVDRSIGKNDTLATWHERYVIVALHGVTPEVVASTIAVVTAKWSARAPTEAPSIVPRSLRTAVLTSEKLAQHGKRALDELVGLLLARRSGAQTPEDDLPFVVAAPKAAVLTRRTAYRRVEALLNALGATLRFIVAVEIAVLQDGVEQELKWLAADLLVRQPRHGEPLVIGAWVSLLWSLADLVAKGPTDAVQSTVATLRTRGSLHASLSAPLARAVALGEKLARGTVVSDDAHRGDEHWLRDLLDRLLAGLRPIMQMRLVSVAEIESIGDQDSGYSYGLYLHRGPAEQFPIVHERIAAPLVKRWCYLLSEDGVRRPLLLSPMVFSGTCDTCGRVEAYLAEGLTLEPTGARVYARTSTTNHDGQAELPNTRRTREFMAFFERAFREKESIPARPPSGAPIFSHPAPSESSPSSFPAPRSLLTEDQLREVRDVAINVGLARERVTLLSHLSRGVVSTLPVASSELSQLFTDLVHLNDIAVADDGSVPLRQWLATACFLRSAYVEVAIFERFIKSIDEAELLESRSRKKV